MPQRPGRRRRRRSALPSVTRSGSRPQAAVQPPGPADSVWVSSLMRSVPCLAVSSRRRLLEARLGQDHPDIGHGRLLEHAGEHRRGRAPSPAPGGELNSMTRVPLVGGQILHLAQHGGRGADRLAVAQHQEGLVDQAVVAAVEVSTIGRPVRWPSPERMAEGGWRRSPWSPSARRAGRSAWPAAPPPAGSAVLAGQHGAEAERQAPLGGSRKKRRFDTWPNMVPVSPRQKSAYSCPSTSVMAAPCRARREGRESRRPSASSRASAPRR